MDDDERESDEEEADVVVRETSTLSSHNPRGASEQKSSGEETRADNPEPSVPAQDNDVAPSQIRANATQLSPLPAAANSMDQNLSAIQRFLSAALLPSSHTASAPGPVGRDAAPPSNSTNRTTTNGRLPRQEIINTIGGLPSQASTTDTPPTEANNAKKKNANYNASVPSLPPPTPQQTQSHNETQPPFTSSNSSSWQQQLLFWQVILQLLQPPPPPVVPPSLPTNDIQRFLSQERAITSEASTALNNEHALVQASAVLGLLHVLKDGLHTMNNGTAEANMTQMQQQSWQQSAFQQTTATKYSDTLPLPNLQVSRALVSLLRQMLSPSTGATSFGLVTSQQQLQQQVQPSHANLVSSSAASTSTSASHSTSGYAVQQGTVTTAGTKHCAAGSVTPVAKRQKRRYRHESFPDKLHRLLAQTEAQGRDDVISWNAEGTVFCIDQPEVFEDEIIGHYFRHSNLSSFKRQLSMYGFTRVLEGPDAGGFTHPLFRKGQVDLSKSMDRVS